MKGGKSLPERRIQKIMDNGGVLILKEPKSNGGKYYITSILEMKNGIVNNEMVYPSYYDEMVNDYDCIAIDSLDGTWIKINYLNVIDDLALNHIRLVSNKMPLDEVMASTRSTLLYVESDMDIEL